MYNGNELIKKRPPATPSSPLLRGDLGVCYLFTHLLIHSYTCRDAAKTCVENFIFEIVKFLRKANYVLS